MKHNYMHTFIFLSSCTLLKCFPIYLTKQDHIILSYPSLSLFYHSQSLSPHHHGPSSLSSFILSFEAIFLSVIYLLFILPLPSSFTCSLLQRAKLEKAIIVIDLFHLLRPSLSAQVAWICVVNLSWVTFSSWTFPFP